MNLSESEWKKVEEYVDRLLDNISTLKDENKAIRSARDGATGLIKNLEGELCALRGDYKALLSRTNMLKNENIAWRETVKEVSARLDGVNGNRDGSKKVKDLLAKVDFYA